MSDRERIINLAGAVSVMLWWLSYVNPAAYLALMGAAAIAAVIAGRE